MADKYNHREIEQKWRELWEKLDLYRALKINPGDKKKYILETFPYPSGYAMHVGHAKGYVASDITARYYRMLGNKVMYPMGWDAFGLPAENYAIKTGIHPRPNTDQTIEVSKAQLNKIGLSYSWEREIATHRPDYYKWTQWLFQLLYKRGLAYKKEALVNWDPVDQTVLANEQVLPDGTGERSGAKVEQRMLSQWFFKITEYADRLIEGLDRVDWPESTKLMQRNWIGQSEGINITYKIEEEPTDITVYTTRPDTNFGATFIVVAPDCQWVKDNFHFFKYKETCQNYIDRTKLKTQLDRLSEGKIKTGEFTGLHAINGLNGLKLPIYLSDFVLSTVGTGAVVGVPGHDIRDFDFAQTKNLPVIRVVVGPDGDSSPINRREQVQEEAGTMINSGFLDGLAIMEAKEKIKDYIEAEGFGNRVINYKLRDWLVSRQRYWGAPIPIWYDSEGKEQLVPESDLPVILPEDVEFLPTGRSPLYDHTEFHSSAESKYGSKARRESDTMDTFVDSSWYFFRYCSPNNHQMFSDPVEMKKWMPVDQYIIGAEHSNLHLLYARFFTKVLFDAGYIEFDEPFLKVRHQGLIQGEDGRKMSKRWGNVVNPDDICNDFGADTLRMYEMFMGPFKEGLPWSTATIKGVRRFLDRVWKLQSLVLSNESSELNLVEQKKVEVGLNKLIKKIGEDIEQFSFNTAVAEYMKFVNVVEKQQSIYIDDFKKFLLVLAPFAPFITDEIWSVTVKKFNADSNIHSIHKESWPKYDPVMIEDAMSMIGIQINGIRRGEVQILSHATSDQVRQLVLELPKIQTYVEGKEIRKFIYIPKKIVNIVV
jgi:leucyl-tRNA synthetase